MGRNNSRYEVYIGRESPVGIDFAGARWIKASASNGNGACVEMTSVRPGEVCMRNSRDPDGPVLRFTEQEWAAFIAGAKAGEFDAIV
jgi:hypothetical protein